MAKANGKKMAASLAAFAALSIGGAYMANRIAGVAAASGLELSAAINTGIAGVLPTVRANPLYVSREPIAVFAALATFVVVWMSWLWLFGYAGNYRYGEESGSARWGTKAEGRRFLDKKNPANNLLFTKEYGLALNRSKFNLELDRNLNVMVIGGAGSGKTRNYVKPNLMQLNASYFLTDPKGTLPGETGWLFAENGYDIRVFDTLHFGGLHYNPLCYVKTDADILSFVNCLISNTQKDGQSSNDPFWENAEKLLYTALIAFLRDWMPQEDYCLPNLLRLLDMAEAREDNEGYMSKLDCLFYQIEHGQILLPNDGKETVASSGDSRRAVALPKRGKASYQPTKLRRSDGVKPVPGKGLSPSNDFALGNYKAFKTAAGKTLKSIIISCNVRLKPLAIAEMQNLLAYDEMKLDSLGDAHVMNYNEQEHRWEDSGRAQSKSVVYGLISDTDHTFAFLLAILMWQTIDQLCRKALDAYGGKLPVPVHFVFDEFANIGTIPDIEQTIAVTRSRNIGISIILQSISQLESRYEKKAQTIVDCCDSTLFLGGKSNTTNKEIAEMIGKETINQKTFGDTRGQSPSSSKNVQIQGRDLIDPAEIGRLSRKKAILLIAGTNPLMDTKYPVEKHPMYLYVDPGKHKGALHTEPFDFEQYQTRKRARDRWEQAFDALSFLGNEPLERSGGVVDDNR